MEPKPETKKRKIWQGREAQVKDKRHSPDRGPNDQLYNPPLYSIVEWARAGDQIGTGYAHRKPPSRETHGGHRGVMPVVGLREWREMSGERDHWSGRCDEWPLANALGAYDLSSCHISPVGIVWRLGSRGGMICGGEQRIEDHEKERDDWLRLTSSDAFPDIYTLSLWIPNATLCVEIPENANFPDSCCVADDGRHGSLKVVRGREI